MLVLLHDPTFGRTVAGAGHVATTTWATLATLDAGSWFAPNFTGERVPRYDDAARFCVEHRVWMNVEIKPAPGFDVRTGEIVAAVTARLDTGSVAPPLLSSFSRAALEAARAVAPGLPRGLLIAGLSDDDLDTARRLDCVSVHVAERTLDAEAIERIHAAGFAALAYTVNDAARLAALEAAGIDAVFTDRLDTIGPERPAVASGDGR